MKSILCRILGHKYYLVKKLTAWSCKIGCARCDKFFGMNYDARAVIDWDYELEAMYKLMGIEV